MTAVDDASVVLDWLRERGVGAGGDVAVTVDVDAVGVGVGIAGTLGMAVAGGSRGFLVGDLGAVLGAVESACGPRWVWWDRATADRFVAAGVAVARCWDVATVHRLLRGGWRVSIPELWAWLHGLPLDSLPAMGQLGLLDDPGEEGDDPEQPVRPDGHLRPEWVSGGWSRSPRRAAEWARLALIACELQRGRLARRADPPRARSTAHAESAAEVLCAELTMNGLPIDVAVAEEIIAAAVGPRPRDAQEALERQAARDRAVLDHAPAGPAVDLRNPGDVRAMLRRVAVDVPNTRASSLTPHRGAHPVVEALLVWRKAERIATTYGYRWLDENVTGGRLRGHWSSSDGAAGRMTASGGLHNLPAEMRPAVAAEPGHVLVRADLGQIEPRVLAAVSGDPALIAATRDDDLYQPVAARLQVPREVAKVAVLGAMYGSTTGNSAPALRGLERAYPIAMQLLATAAAAGQAGDDVFTIGGRRVRMWVDESVDGDIDKARSVAAARGRFARNAVIQGAAAELFKVWAVTVRHRIATVGAEIVLCLHDELLMQCSEGAGEEVALLVSRSLSEAAQRWSPDSRVRFVADVSVVPRWSDVK